MWWLSLETYEAGLALLLPDRTDLASGERLTGTLAITRWEDGKPQVNVLARTEPHGGRTGLAGPLISQRGPRPIHAACPPADR